MYKREAAGAKGTGKIETKEAYPITKELVKNINEWAAEDEDVMVDCWTKTQWNCMSCCGNIDELGFGNFQIALDANVVIHDTTKADKDGEMLKCYI